MINPQHSPYARLGPGHPGACWTEQTAFPCCCGIEVLNAASALVGFERGFGRLATYGPPICLESGVALSLSESGALLNGQVERQNWSVHA